MTREDFQALYELQQIDSAIDARNALLNGADDGSGAQAALEAAQARLSELEEDVKKKQTRQRQLELDLETILAERAEKSERCYGGTVSDPKELSALAAKIDELTRNADRHEDMILELLERLEAAEAALAEQQATVERLTAEHARIVEHFDGSTSRAREEIAELQARRAELVPQIDPGLVHEYENLRARFDGIGVAALVDGKCAVCNVAVPRVQQPMIERGAAAVKCESCRRILVIPEGG